MGEPEAARLFKVKDKRRKGVRTPKTKIGKGLGFGQEVGGKKRQVVSLREGARAKKGDKIAGMKKEAKRRNR
jgi:hypothetical protein